MTNRRYFLPLMAALIALAWLALWAWGQSPYARLLNHHDLDELMGSDSLMLVFIAGWTIMMVAMMLPTSLPLVTLFHNLTRQRTNQGQLVVLLLVGYLCSWTLFGTVIYAGDWILQRALDRNAWLESSAGALAAVTVVLAGLYQVTPLKYYCLDKCRSPLSFIMQYWRGRHDRTQAFRLGVHHGLFCLGCCWLLMLLMFVVGTGSLGWMLALATVMAIEKNMSWGRWLSAPLGVFLLGWGVTLFVSTAPWDVG